jgi:hypothetical protein
MALTFDPADYEKMVRVENEISHVLLRAKSDRVEAAVVAFALVRCARILLDQYRSTGIRRALAEVMTAFLRHDKVTIEGEGDLEGLGTLRLQ